jgi:hypothetical protein
VLKKKNITVGWVCSKDVSRIKPWKECWNKVWKRGLHPRLGTPGRRPPSPKSNLKKKNHVLQTWYQTFYIIYLSGMWSHTSFHPYIFLVCTGLPYLVSSVTADNICLHRAMLNYPNVLQRNIWGAFVQQLLLWNSNKSYVLWECQ